MATATISVWEQDPGSAAQPDGGALIQVTAPDLSATSLPIAITNPVAAPDPAIYAPGSAEFRYWSAAAALNRGSTFWSPLLAGTSWQVGPTLPVDLYYGDDLNAYYDRIGLRFFQGTTAGRTVYSGESPDIVCHEQGHAILDSIKPQLWDAASMEVAAFHESFGDMSAVLCAIQVPSLRQGVLDETGGMLYRSSRLSRLAEQLGWAIRQQYPGSADPDCLRNAVNSFYYQDPDTLPTTGPASTLSSEPHSFSRVFTAAFFEGLAGMFNVQPGPGQQDLLQAGQDMAKILLSAIYQTAVVPSFYSQVAAEMINLANSQFATANYAQALRSAFIAHGILSPSSSVAPVAPIAAFAAAPPAPVAILPKLRLSVAEYGLGTDTILVHAAAGAKRFDAAGAALHYGSLDTVSQDKAAKSFIEDLLRRGKLLTMEADGGPKTLMQVTRANQSSTHASHTHELRQEGDDIVLKRVRIDCK